MKSNKKVIDSEMFSFTAVYKIDSFNQSMSLIRYLPHNDEETSNITRMFINNEEVTPSVNYTFSSPGIYKGMFLDITNMISIGNGKK